MTGKMYTEIPIATESIKIKFWIGDSDGILSTWDINEAEKNAFDAGLEPQKILVDSDGLANLRTNEQFLHEQDILEESEPDGMMFDYPVFRIDMEYDSENPIGILVGENGNVGIDG